MTEILIAAAVLILLTLALVRAIRADGRGRRTPPRSHVPWDEQPLPGLGAR